MLLLHTAELGRRCHWQQLGCNQLRCTGSNTENRGPVDRGGGEGPPAAVRVGDGAQRDDSETPDRRRYRLLAASLPHCPAPAPQPDRVGGEGEGGPPAAYTEGEGAQLDVDRTLGQRSRRRLSAASLPRGLTSAPQPGRVGGVGEGGPPAADTEGEGVQLDDDGKLGQGSCRRLPAASLPRCLASAPQPGRIGGEGEGGPPATDTEGEGAQLDGDRTLGLRSRRRLSATSLPCWPGRIGGVGEGGPPTAYTEGEGAQLDADRTLGERSHRRLSAAPLPRCLTSAPQPSRVGGVGEGAQLDDDGKLGRRGRRRRCAASLPHCLAPAPQPGRVGR